MAEQIPDQQGRLIAIVVPNPAAGVDFLYNLPLRTRWAVRSVEATLTTVLGGANRVPELVFTIGAAPVLRITASQDLAAAGVFIFGWHEGATAQIVATQTSRVASIPPRYLLNDQGSIQVQTVALALGDTWTDIHIVVEEWIEPLV